MICRVCVQQIFYLIVCTYFQLLEQRCAQGQTSISITQKLLESTLCLSNFLCVHYSLLSGPFFSALLFKSFSFPFAVLLFSLHLPNPISQSLYLICIFGLFLPHPPTFSKEKTKQMLVTKNNFLYSDFFEIIASKVFIFSVLSRTCHARFILLRPAPSPSPRNSLSLPCQSPPPFFSPLSRRSVGGEREKMTIFPFTYLLLLQ